VAPGTGIVLDAWERGLQGAVGERAVSLLALSAPSTSADSLAEFPLGVRDQRLIRFRQAMFGDVMECLVDCPACRQPLELAVSASDLLRQVEPQKTEEDAFTFAGHQIWFRSPNSDDLWRLSHLAENKDAFQTQLLRRCVSDIRTAKGESCDPADLSPEIVKALGREMERRDPMSAVRLDLDCPHCGHAWPDLFDIANHLWSDVDDWARQTLRDVHRLARAYGWSEHDVLTMSAARRARYLEMVNS
jgi:hypothetical protein